MNLQLLVHRPLPVEAMTYDGTPESAQAIVDWMGVDPNRPWPEHYTIAVGSQHHHEVLVIHWFEDEIHVRTGETVVLHVDKEIVGIFDPARLTERFEAASLAPTP